jgi:hypothetical protein
MYDFSFTSFFYGNPGIKDAAVPSAREPVSSRIPFSTIPDMTLSVLATRAEDHWEMNEVLLAFHQIPPFGVITQISIYPFKQATSRKDSSFFLAIYILECEI